MSQVNDEVPVTPESEEHLRFSVGDVVSAWTATEVDLVGVVIAVEDFTDEVGPNQKLTVKWFAPADSVEYAQDLGHSRIY